MKYIITPIKLIAGLIILFYNWLFYSVSGYYIRQTLLVCSYAFIVWNSWSFIFGPAVAVYGLGKLLLAMLFFFISAWAVSAAFFYSMLSRPAKPQATLKETIQ